MKIKFVLSAEGRRPLIRATGEILGEQPRYLGAPSFGFAVGKCTFDREGLLTIPEDMDADDLLEKLAQRGFTSEGNPKQGATVISVPVTGFDDAAFSKLAPLILSKKALLCMAFQMDALPFYRDGDYLRFAWFQRELIPEESAAYTLFFEALCKTAKAQNRVSMKSSEVVNPKYEMRCFLLKLGFIGKEYAPARKLFTVGLPGNAAFKHGPDGL